MTRKLRISLKAKSGSFDLFKAKVDGKAIIDTAGGDATKQVETAKTPVKVNVRASGVTGSKLECKISDVTNEHDEKDLHEKNHTLGARGKYEEALEV